MCVVCRATPLTTPLLTIHPSLPLSLPLSSSLSLSLPVSPAPSAPPLSPRSCLLGAYRNNQMVPYDDDGDVSVFITNWGDGAAPGKDSNYKLLWDTLEKAFPKKDEYVVTVEKSLY